MTVDGNRRTIRPVNCAFCDAPVGDDAERCPSCSAILRRTCPSCGKINPVHVETCFACGKALPALPAAPEPTGVDPVEAPKPPLTAGSIVLRAMAFFCFCSHSSRQSEVMERPPF